MRTFSLFFIILGFYQMVFAESIVGEVFEQKTNFGKKLYNLDIDVKTSEGLTKTLAVYKDMKGELAVEEKGVFRGDELISFDVDRVQTHEKGHIEVQGDKILFVYEKDGKKKTSEERLRKPLLTPANFNIFVANHWNEITNGSGMEVRFGVWFRLETVGFKIFKVGEVQKGTQKWIQLRMKPSSFLIAALVDPLNLWYDENTKHLMELSGRVSPKILSGNKFKDLDGDVRYVHPN